MWRKLGHEARISSNWQLLILTFLTPARTLAALWSLIMVKAAIKTLNVLDYSFTVVCTLMFHAKNTFNTSSLALFFSLDILHAYSLRVFIICLMGTGTSASSVFRLFVSNAEMDLPRCA